MEFVVFMVMSFAAISVSEEAEAVQQALELYRFRNRVSTSEGESGDVMSPTVGVEWHTTLHPDKGSLVFFTDGECEPCLKAKKLFNDPDVAKLLAPWHCVEWSFDKAKEYDINVIPVLATFDARGKKVGAVVCPTDKAQLIELLTP